MNTLEPKTTEPPEIAQSQRRPVFDCMFNPHSIAVIGATERPGSVGRTILDNLAAPQFNGNVLAVNPKHRKLLQHPCYPSISKVPGPVDLAVIVTPAPTVPALVGQCVDAGV